MNETYPFNSEETDGMSQREQLEKYFSQSLEVELLLRLCPDDEDIIYQIVDLLVDTCATKRKIHEEKDILKLVTTLMTNTKGEGQGGDPFWDKAERLLLTSLIAYLHYEAPAEEQNFATLLEMLNTMQVSEEDEDYQNPVDLLFEDLAKKKPNSFAGRQYKLYKLAAGKTAKSILISCGARLSPFDIQEIRDCRLAHPAGKVAVSGVCQHQKAVWCPAKAHAPPGCGYTFQRATPKWLPALFIP